MIYLKTGRTGRGKTFDTILEILEDMKNLNVVFTNIKLHIESPLYVYMDELAMINFIAFINDTFSNVDNLEEKKNILKTSKYFGAKFYIDEAHLVGFQKKSDGINNWLTLQRHFNQDIHVITQVPTNIHRDYLPQFHHHRDMLKSIIPNTFGYKDFDGFKGEKLRTKFYRPNAMIFDLYSTGNSENSVHPFVYKLGGVLILLIIGSFYLFSKFSNIRDIGQSGNDSTLSNFSSKSSFLSKDTDSDFSNFTYLKLTCISDTCINKLHKIELNIDDLNLTVTNTQSKFLNVNKYSPTLGLITILASEDFINLFQGANNGKKKNNQGYTTLN